MSRSEVKSISRMFVTLIGLILLVSSAQQSQGRTASETTAMLRKITCAVPPLSMVERVDACIKLLELETNSPSAPSYGIGGGPIDTGYIQEVIMGSVCTFAQKETDRKKIRSIITARLQATPAQSQTMRDKLIIILGTTGDASVIPQLINILENNPQGFMRVGAVWALHEIKDCHEAITTLKYVAENDNYARIRFSSSIIKNGSSTTVYSPVRNIASEILKRMDQSLPDGIEVVADKYGVQRVEPLLYDINNRECITKSIEVLGMIGSNEAKIALQKFIEIKRNSTAMSEFVYSARLTLAEMNSK